eukprot:4226092-Amphidinium_carterae.2
MGASLPSGKVHLQRHLAMLHQLAIHDYSPGPKPHHYFRISWTLFCVCYNFGQQDISIYEKV